MSWFKVDDQFADHPKVIALRSRKGWHRALSLWTLAGAWAARQLTDGFVPEGMVTILGCARPDAVALVEVGLWEPAEGGYRFHDYHDINPTRAHVEDKREKTKRKVNAWRDKKRDGNPVTPAACNQVTEEVVTDHVTLPPARPGPIPTTNVVGARAPESPLAAHEAAIKRARSVLRRGYAERYERGTRMPGMDRGDAWQGASGNAQAIDTAAGWCAAEPDDAEARAAAILDGMFADPWLTERRWPWGPIARDPAKYAAAGRRTPPPMDELARLRAALDALEPARNRAVTAGARGVAELARIEAEQDAIRSQIADHRKRTNNPNPIARAS